MKLKALRRARRVSKTKSLESTWLGWRRRLTFVLKSNLILDFSVAKDQILILKNRWWKWWIMIHFPQSYHLIKLQMPLPSWHLITAEMMQVILVLPWTNVSKISLTKMLRLSQIRTFKIMYYHLGSTWFLTRIHQFWIRKGQNLPQQCPFPCHNHLKLM